MVVVQCYHCSKILELDEGFRGGVCRCSQCGSLLQVPKAATAGTAKTRPAAPGVRAAEDRPASPASDPGLSRGQFDPRSGMGSGLAASGARPQRPDTSIGTGAFAGSGSFAPSPAVPTGPRRIEKVAPVEPAPGMPTAATHARQVRKGRLVLVISLVSIVALIGLGGWLIFAVVASMRVPGGKTAATAPTQPETGSSVGPIVTSTAQTPVGFFGVKLTGRKVVISVDSGGSMRDVYDHFRKNFDVALRQLDDSQQIRVVIWQSPPIIVPADGWARKSERARFKPFEDSYATSAGQDVASNMAASLKLGADQTIFVTAKIDFPYNLADTIAKARRADQRVDTIWVSSSEEESPLKKIAESTGGTAVTLPPSDAAHYYP